MMRNEHELLEVIGHLGKYFILAGVEKTQEKRGGGKVKFSSLPRNLANKCSWFYGHQGISD